MGPLQAVFKADGGETGERMSVSEWWLEPKTAGPGVHAHDDEHMFYVLEGVLSLCLDGDWIDLARGAYVIIPGGTPHDFQNRGDVRAGFMAVNVPGGFEGAMAGIEADLRARDLKL
ncbi:cupin domain-containing protein [Caulobacter sp. 17J65-9]|nr:cupin domain-containing protein [Caulobacter sp. 17J65-9]